MLGERLPKLESLWLEDPEETAHDVHFDPFDPRLPGESIRDRLRYLFLNVVVKRRDKWRAPGKAMQIIALKCLYAALVGFRRDNVALLYPSGTIGDTLDSLFLAKAQLVEGPSVRDRCCGHVFEKGETYYRCK